MTTFRDELEDQCADMAEKYNFKRADLGRGFEALSVHLSAVDGGFVDALGGLPVLEADMGDYIFRHNEGGVDGILEDEDNSVMMLIQAKYLSAKTRPTDDQVKAHFGLIDLLGSPGAPAFLAKLDPRAAEILGAVHERLADGWTFVLRFVTNSPIEDRLRTIADGFNAGFERDGRAIKCEIVGQEELKAIWTEALSSGGRYLGPVTFNVRNHYSIDFAKPRHTLVAVISGNELANLFKQHRNGLFAENIRLPMLSATRINPEIRSTATDHPGDFFYFNNGVSAVCRSFTVDKNVVSADEFQIINGAQTVGTLGSLPKLDPLVQVLFRLTESPADLAFRDDVTRTNNTQNEVVPWDFRANDPVQKSLEVALKAYSGTGPIPNFWYKRKRGLDAKANGGRAVEPEYLGKLRHSWIYGPIVSYKEPKLLASTTDKSGRYYEAFGDNGKKVLKLTKAQVDQLMLAYAVDAHVLRRAEQLKATGHLWAVWMKRLSRYVTSVVGELSRRVPALDLSPGRLLALSPEDFAKELKPLIDQICDKINDRYLSLKAGRVQPEYDIARDQASFEQLCASLQALLTA